MDDHIDIAIDNDNDNETFMNSGYGFDMEEDGSTKKQNKYVSLG